MHFSDSFQWDDQGDPTLCHPWLPGEGSGTSTEDWWKVGAAGPLKKGTQGWILGDWSEIQSVPNWKAPHLTHLTGNLIYSLLLKIAIYGFVL